MKIGITDGICAEGGRDILRALEFAAGKSGMLFRAEVVQVRLNEELVENPALQAEIARKAKEYKLELVTHGNPNDNGALETIGAHAAILKYQPQKKAVIHFRPKMTWNTIHSFKKQGIRVFIENTNSGLSILQQQKTHEDFMNFLLRNKRDVGCVLDIGRFFQNEKKSAKARIIAAVVEDCRILKKNNIPVIYHTTGYRNFAQRKDDRVYPGAPDDMIPHGAVFRGMAKYTSLENAITVIGAGSADDAINGAKYLRFL